MTLDLSLFRVTPSLLGHPGCPPGVTVAVTALYAIAYRGDKKMAGLNTDDPS